MVRSLAVVIIGMVVGCGGSDDGSPGVVCGAGTHEENGSCVPDGQGPDGGSTADAPAFPGKRVFVTRTTYRGDIGGLFGADTKCNGAAASASLPGTYKAWLSVFNNGAIDRITGNGPWYDVSGVMVFANHAALTAAPLVALNKGEDGSEIPGDRVWTATSAGGDADGAGDSDFCYTWSSQSGNATAGNTASTDGGWTSLEVNLPCNNAAHLYCFQE